jgi:methanogenic corrinoid protein MtbC1
MTNNSGSENAKLAEELVETLLAGKRQAANTLILDRVKEGLPIQTLYLEVFQPALYKIGMLWQENSITVAQEHYCTAAIQMIMSMLYTRIFKMERNGKTLVATCVGGELHEIGIRMVADFFEMEGWDTYYYGANTPIRDMIETIRDINPDVIAISAAMSFNVATVKDLIREIRVELGEKAGKILVGGRPFNISKDLWKEVDADGYAVDASQAVSVAGSLIAM